MNPFKTQSIYFNHSISITNPLMIKLSNFNDYDDEQISTQPAENHDEDQ
jgi:hypothetical protein